MTGCQFFITDGCHKFRLKPIEGIRILCNFCKLVELLITTDFIIFNFKLLCGTCVKPCKRLSGIWVSIKTKVWKGSWYFPNVHEFTLHMTAVCNYNLLCSIHYY